MTNAPYCTARLLDSRTMTIGRDRADEQARPANIVCLRRRLSSLRLAADLRLVAGMKGLFFIGDLGVGGSQRQLAVLAAGLAQRGHDVAVVVLYAGGALEALLEGSSARCLSIGKSGRWHALAPLARLRRLFLSERPDLVYAFLPHQTTGATLLLPPQLKSQLGFGLAPGGVQRDQQDRVTPAT